MTPTGITALSSIFFVSLLGSWHCGLMCGGFSMSLTQGLTSRLINYHLGRMLSYTLMGGVAGSIGSLALSQTRSLKYVTVGLIGLLLIISIAFHLIELISQSTVLNPFHRISKIQNHWLQKTMKWVYGKPFASFHLGFISVFLPCGWLYGFLLAAVASGSFRAGGLTMFVFWLGGLPALTLGSIYLRKSFQKLSPQWQPILQLIVLISALFSLLSFYI